MHCLPNAVALTVPVNGGEPEGGADRGVPVCAYMQSGLVRCKREGERTVYGGCAYGMPRNLSIEPVRVPMIVAESSLTVGLLTTSNEEFVGNRKVYAWSAERNRSVNCMAARCLLWSAKERREALGDSVLSCSIHTTEDGIAWVGTWDVSASCRIMDVYSGMQ